MCLIVFVSVYVDLVGTKDAQPPTLSPKLVKGSIHPQPRHCSAADIPPVAGAVFTWSLPRFKLQSLGNGQLLLLVRGMNPHPSILTTNITMKTQMCFLDFCTPGWCKDIWERDKASWFQVTSCHSINEHHTLEVITAIEEVHSPVCQDQPAG